MKPLVILGPTGAGKSAIALEIAEKYGAKIVSMDAMAVYRGMDIGTAKASAAERARVPHYGLDLRNPDEPFTAMDFRDLADSVAGPKILVGGTTFYFRAWIQGIVAAPVGDPALRAELEKLEDPWIELQKVDPVLSARLHPNDRVRILRGLEVFLIGGRPLSELHAEDPKLRRDAEVIWVDREDLYEVIDQRVLKMMAAGYLEEVQALRAAGYGPQHKPMLSLGYKHLSAFLDGSIDRAEAVRRTQTESRNFARKQRSFLRSWGLVPGGDPWLAADRAFSF
jgi:tRNA dimethylallyltransferase